MALTPARSSTDVAHRVDERDGAVDELRHVLVARRDQHLLARARGAAGEGADDVVRFDAVHAQHRQALGAQDREQRLDLRAQIVRHGRAVRLVFREDLVAEGLAAAHRTPRPMRFGL